MVVCRGQQRQGHYGSDSTGNIGSLITIQFRNNARMEKAKRKERKEQCRAGQERKELKERDKNTRKDRKQRGKEGIAWDRNKLN